MVPGLQFGNSKAEGPAGPASHGPICFVALRPFVWKPEESVVRPSVKKVLSTLLKMATK
jgi:hypothetical protein